MTLKEAAALRRYVVEQGDGCILVMDERGRVTEYPSCEGAAAGIVRRDRVAARRSQSGIVVSKIEWRNGLKPPKDGDES